MSAFRVGEEVAAARAAGTAVVALETSVIGQGLPHPRNLECIERMSAAIALAGAVPAWVGVVEGAVVVGLDDGELARFAEPGRATKVARRDLPIAVASGVVGATTVSATIWAAARAGIPMSATGGIGGVHPGEDPDVSADLLELARTPGMLVCSGPKSIIDPAATAEKLEELGRGDDRGRGGSTPVLPRRARPRWSWSTAPIPRRMPPPCCARRSTCDTRSTLLLCNPVPEGAAMEAEEVARAAAQAEAMAGRAGVHGKARTPFLLAALAELTDGRSLEANLALLEANARLAGAVAAAV